MNLELNDVQTPVLVAVALLIGWWLWWRMPKRQMRSVTAADPKARADIEDNFRKTIGQLLGGAAVLIGAALAYVQFSQQQQTSQRQFAQQQQASRDLLISSQLSKGFEQLGSDKLVVRLGGIYALGGVMNASEQYYRPLLEALSAFVRDGTSNEKGDGSPAIDIQATLTVIGRRKETGFRGVPDLSNAHIPKALLEGANLYGANLAEANLAGAILNGANLTFARLSHAILHHASLSDANLLKAYLPLALLNGADLTFARLTAANLSDAILTGADLRGATITQDAVGSGLRDGREARSWPGDKAMPLTEGHRPHRPLQPRWLDQVATRTPLIRTPR